MEGRNPSSGIDRISALPDDIMPFILGSLTTKEIMRTSVLSKTWRHKWRLAPKFTIDNDLTTDEVSLWDFACRVLFYHIGSLEKFSITLQEVRIINPPMDEIASHLKTKGVFDLGFKIEEGEGIPIPLPLFSCDMLKRLNLERFVIMPPPGFRGFPNLIKLHLADVLVERVALEGIIAGSRFLKKISLKDIFNIVELNVNASELEAFYYEGVELRVLNFQAPLLNDYVFNNEAEEPKPANFLESGLKVQGFPPAMEVMKLNGDFWKFVGMLKNLLQTRPNIFNKVYLFEVGEMYFKDVEEVSCLLKFLEYSPNLKTLYVKGGREMSPNVEPIEAFWRSLENRQFSFGQLARVTLNDFLGSWSQLMFIELLLASSPLLETLMIHPLTHDFRYDDRVMTRRVLRYRRVSPNAEVLFFPLS